MKASKGSLLLELARKGELYPSVILHGGTAESRRDEAIDLARTLLCAEAPEARPCGRCRHCRRIVQPSGSTGSGDDLFHPDFRFLERDLKTSTSVGAVKEMLRMAQVSPYEARGQVFVIASAETLSGEAANALLKSLEEPHDSAPRNFFLLAPARLDLLPTLRSRSLAHYLGAAEAISPEIVDPIARSFSACLSAWCADLAPIWLLAAADSLKGAGGWDDPRAEAPWATAAQAVVASRGFAQLPRSLSRPLLDLALDLMRAPRIRVRGIPADRILEGLISRHLGRANP